MKKISLPAAIFLLTASIFAAPAEKYQVPILWQSSSKTARLQIFGMASTPGQYVFAFRIPELKNYDGKSRKEFSIYFDTDDDPLTGRSPGGCDYQINVNLGRNAISTLTWDRKKAKYFRFNRGDYTLEVRKDVLLIVIKAPLPGVHFKDNFSMQIMPFKLNYKLQMSKPQGTLLI